MGMSASQARLLSITARMSDNELRAQQNSNTKIRLASDSEKVSADYLDALSQKNINLIYFQDGTRVSDQLSYSLLTDPNCYLGGQYWLQNFQGAMMIDTKMNEAFSNCGGDFSKFLAAYNVDGSLSWEDEMTSAEEAQYKSLQTAASGAAPQQYITENYKYQSGGTKTTEYAAGTPTEAEVAAAKQAMDKANADLATYKSEHPNSASEPSQAEIDALAALNAYKATSPSQDETDAYKAWQEALNDYNDYETTKNNGVAGRTQAEIDADKASQNAAIATANANITSLNTEFGKNETSITTLKKELSGTTEEYLNNELAVCEEEINNLDEKMSKLALRIAASKSGKEIEELEAKMTELFDRKDTALKEKLEEDNKSRKYEYLNKLVARNENITNTLIPAERKKIADAQAALTTLADEKPGQSSTYDESVAKTKKDLADSKKTIYDNYKNTREKADEDRLDALKEAYEKLYNDRINSLNNETLKSLETAATNATNAYNLIAQQREAGKIEGTSGGETKTGTKKVINPEYTAWKEAQDELAEFVEKMQAKYSTSSNGDSEAKFYKNYFDELMTGNYVYDKNLDTKEGLEWALRTNAVLVKYDQEKGTWNSDSWITNTNLQEVADDSNVAAAEAKYQLEMSKIQTKEKRIDMEQQTIDTEHSALQTEYDSVKKVIDKNIEITFKMFS